MTGKDKSPAGTSDKRKARLAAELRANLAKRKEQARSRRAGDGDTRPDGIASASEKENSGGKQR